MVSKGAQALNRICSEDPRGQVGVAERLGEYQSLVSRWVAGDRTPSADRRIKMDETLGIPFKDWSEAAEETAADTERPPA